MNAANAVRDIVPAQNNLISEVDWCYPCNQAHNQSTCSNGMINQALMVQNAASSQPDIPPAAPEQQQDMHTMETGFLNWQDEEFNGMNGDSPIAANTRAKKRALDIGQTSEKGKGPATEESSLKSTQIPSILKKVPVAAAKEQFQKDADTSVVKTQQKVHSAVPYSIVDTMKKMNVTMSMWDSLAIPGQVNSLKKALNEEIPPKVTFADAIKEVVLTNTIV